MVFSAATMGYACCVDFKGMAIKFLIFFDVWSVCLRACDMAWVYTSWFILNFMEDFYGDFG